MISIFNRFSSMKLPRRRREDKNADFSQEHKGALECPVCRNVHFKKHWYASRARLADVLKLGDAADLEKAVCPACTMIKEHTFEGEVLLESFPSHLHHELLLLVKNFGRKAKEMDPQSRIIEIEKNRGGYRVTTTENQLANKLAKKVRDSFGNVNIEFSHLPEPARVERVHVVFLQKER